MAVSPQMVKSYAAGNHDRAIKLVLMSSKFSFMLIFVLAFPLLCNMNTILEFWLGADSKTPYMLAFSKLILLYTLILTLEPPITSIIQATGNIKRYQLWVGAITLSYIPITAIVLSFGVTPVMTLIVLMILMSIAQWMRVYIVHHQVGLSYAAYYKKVLLPLLKVIIIALPLYWVIVEWNIHGLWTTLICKTSMAAIFGLFIAATLGLDSKDRLIIKDFVKSKVKRS